jgi:hypothetical protein
MFLWVFLQNIMAFSSSPQTVIVHREVMGPSELISKRNLLKREASSFQSVMFQKHQLIGWRETFGMLDPDIVDDGDPNQKKANQRQL